MPFSQREGLAEVYTSGSKNVWNSLCGQLIAHVRVCTTVFPRVSDPSAMAHKQCCASGKLLRNCRESQKLLSEATCHVTPMFTKIFAAHLAPHDILPHEDGYTNGR